MAVCAMLQHPQAHTGKREPLLPERANPSRILAAIQRHFCHLPQQGCPLRNSEDPHLEAIAFRAKGRKCTVNPAQTIGIRNRSYSVTI